MSSQAIFSKIELIKHPDSSASRAGVPIAPSLISSRPVMLRSAPAASTSLNTGHPAGLTMALPAGSLSGLINLPHVGERTYQFAVPGGMQLHSAQALALPDSSSGAVVQLKSQVQVGATGSQSVTVSYSIPPGGQLRIRVRVYAKAIPTPSTGDNQEDEVEVLHLSDFESIDRMSSLMASRKRVVVLVDHPDVFKLAGTGFFGDVTWEVSMGPTGPRIKINPTWEWPVIIGIIAAAFVAALLIAFLTRMVTDAIANCYKINVSSVTLGQVTVAGVTLTLTLPTMSFDLEPAQCA